MEKLKVKRDFGKRYRNGDIATKHYKNCQYIRNFTNDLFNESTKLYLEDKEKFIEFEEKYVVSLTDSHVDEFTELWGKQDFCYSGEYYSRCWCLTYKGCEAIVFTAKGMGTTLEFILNDKLRPKGSVAEFFEEYYRIIVGLYKKNQ